MKLKFICNYCGAEFKSFLELMLHTQNFHNDDVDNFIEHLDKCRKKAGI